MAIVQTRGRAIIEDAEAVYRQVTALGRETFARSDLSAIIEPFTSRIEFFLKAVVFPDASRRANLSVLIDDLADLGVRTTSVEALHRLRDLYNVSKHDPDKELKWRECVGALSEAVGALKDLDGLGLAAVNAAFQRDLKSVIYVSFWDHYTSGETEVGLFLPSDHWLGTSPISTFHLPISAWDQLKPLLVGHPQYERGEEAIGNELWTSFSKESDFLDAGVWEGDVRELLILLSPFNDETLETAVIPLLARRNDLLSVGIALVSAAVDVARADPMLTGQAFRQRVANRAEAEYSAELATPLGQKVLDAVGNLLENVPVAGRAALSGPAFRRADTRTLPPGAVPLRLDGATIVWLII